MAQQAEEKRGKAPVVRAALLIIGDEILSGRTRDLNGGYIAAWLAEAGIALCEIRVVGDEQAAIIDAVTPLRQAYDYLFTTGGIGPTHDDITAAAIAAALDLPFVQNADALKRLEDHYGDRAAITPARARMAMMPEGAVLIDNPVSGAPGFQVGNIFTMAGVPKIMQAMLESLRPRLRVGQKIHTQTLTVQVGESVIADYLRDFLRLYEEADGLSMPNDKAGKSAGEKFSKSSADKTGGTFQEEFAGHISQNKPRLSIGSYPYFPAEAGRYGVRLVFKSADKILLQQAFTAFQSWLESQQYNWHEGE